MPPRRYLRGASRARAWGGERGRPRGAACIRACCPTLRPTSVVVVLRGIPLKCLREDMAIASVLEILAMVS